MGKDYLAMRSKEPEDREDHGIKGMRWGIRRNDRQIVADQSKRQAKGEEVTKTAKSAAAAPSASGSQKPAQKGNIQDNVESSQSRYARLASQANSGRASEMSEQDLKFFNARTEALAKINKMNERDPGWLSKTTKTVLQSTAQKTMQDISNGVANKYITSPVLDAINKSASAKS